MMNYQGGMIHNMLDNDIRNRHALHNMLHDNFRLARCRHWDGHIPAEESLCPLCGYGYS